MADPAGRDPYESGPGSPLPAEYGSLGAPLPPAEPVVPARRRRRTADEPAPGRAERSSARAATAPPVAPASTRGTGGLADPLPAARPARRPKTRVVHGVRSRRLVRRLDVWTVFKVSLIFYLLALLMVLIAVLVLWSVAQATGVVDSIDRSVRTLFDLKRFALHAGSVFGYTAAGGAVLAVGGTLLNVLAAVTYNLISDLIGGIQLVVVADPGED